jgi:NADPH-dependent 2,4-dienoyl-CoA reductase/sulfur reductase-like enzyme/nitrite reductase/ring-hydroxylating ferredoxin subunit
MGGEAAPLTGPDLTRGVSATDVAEGGMLLGHAGGEAVLLARCGGELFAVGARCPHYGGPLNEGLVVDGTVRCPWHHAAFDLRTGDNVRPPALDGLPCWRVEERDGKAVVLEKRPAPARRTTAEPGAPRGVRPPESVIVLGGGAAGAVAAETLRREGYEGPITMIEAGPAAPYDRPNLSKDYLAGTAPEDWIPLRPDSFYSDRGIDLVLGRRAAALDVHAKRLVLDDGATHDFGALLIATGADPVRLDIPDPGQRVHYLRTLADARAIIAAATDATRVVVLGASFIGLEVAASLRARGLEVTVVAPESRPLERVLGPQLGDFVRGIHEQHGIHFRLGQTVSAIGRSGVTLRNGEHIPARFVVAGIGVRPSVEIAQRAKLATDHGILVNEYLETAVPGIYAAGDVARWPDARTGERTRVEHWVVAQRQGQTAARNILGRRERFDAVPFFWSQHYDVTIAYVGHAERWERVDIDGDIAKHDAEVRFRQGDRTLAVATIFRDRASLAAEAAMERALPHLRPTDDHAELAKR